MEIDRDRLAEFLRLRREALQPEDVGMPRGQRRRTSGLRREEVAALAHMSTDYYARLERSRGPRPSEQMIAAIAQGLHLSLPERDHLFRLAGHHPPAPGGGGEHISPGLQRVLDRLHDTPAEIVSELGETLRQTPLGVALTGESTGYRGMARSVGYRWFTDPAVRALYAPEEHDFLGRMFTSQLRALATRRGPGSRADRVAERLRAVSPEFARLWDVHEIGIQPRQAKRFVHPELGTLMLTCQTLLDPEQSHALLVYTAVPGSEDHEKLQLLAALGPRTAP